MSRPTPGAPRLPSASPGPALVPILMISKGRVMLPGEDGPEVARGTDQAPLDLFDVADFLSARYARTYVVDLDGIETNRPQLDYLQELARDADIWVDAGVRTGDQAIDVLVTGARRAVLSSSRLRSPRELKKAWNLSQDLAFEVELRDRGTVAAGEEWAGQPPVVVAQSVRAVGVSDLIVSYREGSIDWGAVRAVATGGPVWVDGVFERSQATDLAGSGAAGGLFHVFEEVREFVRQPPESTQEERDDRPTRPPDDEKRTS